MCDFESVADYLPSTILEIVEVIGFANTEKLVRKLGGACVRFSCGQFYFPKVVEAVGIENAKLLRHYFGGKQAPYIPRCAEALRILRNQRFIMAFEQLKNQGMSGRMIMLELCPQYGISERHAWDIIQKGTTLPISQASLF